MVLVVLVNVFQYMCGHSYTEKDIDWWTLWLVILLMPTLLSMCHHPPHSLCSPNSIVLLGCGETYTLKTSFLLWGWMTQEEKNKGTHFLLLEFWVKQYLWRKELKQMQKLPSFLLAELVFSSAGSPCLWEALWGQLKAQGSLSELNNHTYLSLSWVSRVLQGHNLPPCCPHSA